MYYIDTLKRELVDTKAYKLQPSLSEGLDVDGYGCHTALYILVSKLKKTKGAQWLSGRVLDLRPRGRGFEPHQRHWVVSLSKTINPSSVLVQHRKNRPFITERLLVGRKESNQTNKENHAKFLR